MIQSEAVLLTKLRQGCTIAKGGYMGFKLHDPTSPQLEWVKSRLVTALEETGKIVRIDDRSSRVGMTWGLPTGPETQAKA
jgi:hypothetical protein